ncbi:MAG: hypothetical protein MUF64_00060 [Polyangiaceae bacterium]|jgi:hypothetical protein|nr:hypothetical protein [Polyangiaceae bacterium]
MSRRVKLPVVERDVPSESTVELLRRSLGGALSPGEVALAGRFVALQSQPERPLVVLFESQDEAHLWVGQGRVRKAPVATLTDPTGAPSPELHAVARDIRRLHTLGEGARVGVLLPEPPGAIGRGVLVERCRFGALVRVLDGRVLAVGFRRLWADESLLN